MAENKRTVTIHTTVRPCKSLQVTPFHENKSQSLVTGFVEEEKFLIHLFQ